MITADEPLSAPRPRGIEDTPPDEIPPLPGEVRKDDPKQPPEGEDDAAKRLREKNP